MPDNDNFQIELKGFSEDVKAMLITLIKTFFDFAVLLDSQRRPSPRPADRSAIELLRTIRNAGDVEMDDFSDEFWQEVDAVLKTAGGG